jgi:hypothetical protein
LFTGHYSFSFAGKSADRCIPLWLLFIAVQFIDVLWSIFVLLGIENAHRAGHYRFQRAGSLLHALYAPVRSGVLVNIGVCGLPSWFQAFAVCAPD